MLNTDIAINKNHPDFAASGWKKPSTIRLSRLMTVRTLVIQRELGQLSQATQQEIARKLSQLFQ